MVVKLNDLSFYYKLSSIRWTFLASTRLLFGGFLQIPTWFNLLVKICKTLVYFFLRQNSAEPASKNISYDQQGWAQPHCAYSSREPEQWTVAEERLRELLCGLMKLSVLLSCCHCSVVEGCYPHENSTPKDWTGSLCLSEQVPERLQFCVQESM